MSELDLDAIEGRAQDLSAVASQHADTLALVAEVRRLREALDDATEIQTRSVCTNTTVHDRSCRCGITGRKTYPPEVYE